MNSSEIFQELTFFVQSDETLEKYAKTGMCRIWHGLTLKKLNEIKVIFEEKEKRQIGIEARETQINSCLTHTILEIIISDHLNSIQDVFIMDGTGVDMHPPYFGLKKDGPQYVKQDSWKDIINYEICIFDREDCFC